jgi:hypothetical protein
MKLPIFTVIRDINNYLFLRKTIKTESKTLVWQKFNLRYDWLGRIYTVVNLPPEVTLSPDAPEEIRPAYVLEETRQINEYLTGLNLHEIIMPEFKPLEGGESYLVIYYPVFQKLSLTWILSRIGLIFLAWWLEKKFSLFSLGLHKAYDLLMVLIDFIKV